MTRDQVNHVLNSLPAEAVNLRVVTTANIWLVGSTYGWHDDAQTLLAMETEGHGEPDTLVDASAIVSITWMPA